jgi:hypothetical protein
VLDTLALALRVARLPRCWPGVRGTPAPAFYPEPIYPLAQVGGAGDPVGLGCHGGAGAMAVSEVQVEDVTLRIWTFSFNMGGSAARTCAPSPQVPLYCS